MKLLCLILFLYVTLLSAKPCCTDNDCQAKSNAKKELSQKAPVKEKECAGCSPFFTCGSCTGFIVAKPVTLRLPVTIEKEKACFTVYQQPSVENVPLPIWLPPKLS